MRTVCRRQKERQRFFLRILIDGGARGTRKAMDTVSLGPSTDQEQQMAADWTKQEQRHLPIPGRLHEISPPRGLIQSIALEEAGFGEDQEALNTALPPTSSRCSGRKNQ